jgi:nitric oxide dioxygenase
MTAEQKRRIRESFQVVAENAGPVAMLFYGRLFAMDPSTKRLFHNDLALQGRKLMEMLRSVVESLDRFEAIRPRLEELGQLHAGYGVKREQYATLETALLWALGQSLGPEWDGETRESWQAAIGAINAAMIAGAEKTERA